MTQIRMLRWVAKALNRVLYLSWLVSFYVDMSDLASRISADANDDYILLSSADLVMVAWPYNGV